MTLTDLVSIGALVNCLAVLASPVYPNIQTRQTVKNQQSLMQHGGRPDRTRISERPTPDGAPRLRRTPPRPAPAGAGRRSRPGRVLDRATSGTCGSAEEQTAGAISLL
ncbi:hypothetical protein, partial [Phenylobacterium sp.]|uniref:hypothetical protein n=1 Tax=Phenylobacterium sp. TaxID=1871053 RepID=UPI0025D33719